MGCISINIERQSGIYASAYRKDGINASASLFCETGTGNYLLVTPTETQWVTVEISADYNVSSNTNWNLE